MYAPVVKWSGSKRTQADAIVEHFPKEIDTYYEPFCGGASVLRKLLATPEIKVQSFRCSDRNADLIGLWNYIKDKPEIVAEYYEQLWCELNKDEDLERKKQFFLEVRSRYNSERNPLDFMFIMRTTVNGMPRYNKKGDFNNTLHVTRKGIEPKTLTEILKEWAHILNLYKVVFEVKDYRDIRSKEKDFLYLDPPYAGIKGMYYGSIDNDAMWKWLREQQGGYVLSFDGKSGEIDNTYAVPNDLYREHKYLLNGKSSFKKTIGKMTDSMVYESLYIK